MRNFQLVFCLVILTASGAAVAQDFSSLEERMSAEEFGRAGLDKLSRDELRYLNEWLKKVKRGPPAVTAPAPAATNTPAAPAADSDVGFRPKDSARTTIHSAIDGDFTGWSGRTRFKLQNGMLWQQVGSGEFFYSAQNPKVRIEPKSLGSWKLYVEGTSRSVKVKRIK